MVTVFDVQGSELIKTVAEKLKKIDAIKPPAWAAYAKTGMHKERPPVKEDWWYQRSASVLRRIYLMGPIGVAKLRGKYGGRKNRGHMPDKFFKGSGNIIRKVLQQLEKAQLVKQQPKGIHKGRVIAAKGKALLDNAAKEIFKQAKPMKQEKPVPEQVPAEKPKQEAKRPEQKQEKPLEQKKPTQEHHG